MQLKSKKNRISEFILSLLDRTSYTRHELDKIIVGSISRRYLSEPMYAVDHLRRALVDYGYMSKDPVTDIYTITETTEKLQVQHHRIESGLQKAIDDAPEVKVQCEFCDNKAKPSAMLNHYYKKHSLKDYLDTIKQEFGNSYING
ncbi:hypothetical protein Q4574_15315 [Aliiglaciecola sp. 3_MG-2023]|uniref:hypothetical protein n=1 Tax=Aliiglaciecola sp. 3_MG-2023 TaxID=3062644 RepID=UPI0026E34269|nr:hypothetical protein [Aliiglaciecola sp. 3_MG-2023]MDO6694665.1 hypothetical protein [Aliiglaciecola sp. 3_MG-2023]